MLSIQQSIDVVTQVAWFLLKQKADASARTEGGSHGLYYLCRIKEKHDKHFEPLFSAIVKSGIDPKAPIGITGLATF